MRVKVLYVTFFLIGISIAGKILYVQYGPDAAELRRKAHKITFERDTISAARGDILSHDNRTLATSIPEFEVRMDFAAEGLTDSLFLKNVDSLSARLASFFGNKSAESYKAMLTEAYKDKYRNRYKLISPRKVGLFEIKEIRNFPLFKLGPNRSGFIDREVSRRIRPHGTLASRTVGMINESGTKVGIEGAFDSMLRGVGGSVMMQRISGNFKIPVPDPFNMDPVNGTDVVSTIDVEIQDVAETALRRRLIDADADWGTAILMEVETGKIRAIANLTNKREGGVVEDYNYAIGMNIEPGSTFKLASLITLLEDAGASLDEVYDVGLEPRAIVKGQTKKISDTHYYGNGKMTLLEIFEKSSNIGFALAVNKYYKDDPNRFVDNLYKIGLAQPFDLQIPGAAAPVVKRKGDRWWDALTLTMMSHGYALQLTPLKTLTLYNAVANRGKMVQPMFVSGLSRFGQSVEEYKPAVTVGRIASEKTLRQVHEALLAVVHEGTATSLQSPYYKVAAKTGTAQIAQGRYGYRDQYGRINYLATMVGYFPAENPKYSCIVAIKTVQGKTYYGASLSGPVFKAIADRVYARSTSWQNTVAQMNEKSTKKPAIKPGRTEEVRRVANRFGVEVDPPRKAQWYNRVATEISKDSMEIKAVAIDPQSGIVPAVKGMGLKEALYILEKEGLIVAFEGRGQVVSQSIKAGEKAQRGTVIALKLEI